MQKAKRGGKGKGAASPKVEQKVATEDVKHSETVRNLYKQPIEALQFDWCRLRPRVLSGRHVTYYSEAVDAEPHYTDYRHTAYVAADESIADTWHVSVDAERVVTFSQPAAEKRGLLASAVMDTVTDREWVWGGLNVSSRKVEPGRSLQFGHGHVVESSGSPLTSLSIGEQPLLPANNARLDRHWRWFTEEGCPVLQLGPRHTELELRFTLNAPTSRAALEPSSIGAAQFSMWECDEKGGAELSVPVPCSFTSARAGGGKLAKSAVMHVYLLKPERRLKPKTVYCYSVNDWHLHAMVGPRMVAECLADSPLADVLPAGVRSVVAAYVGAPPGPPLMRIRSSFASEPFETLGGWRVFVRTR